MKKNTQKGFSLIELLCVVTIIGIIAALGVPSFQKGIRAADNGAAFATLRTMSAVQLNFYSQNGRFANLNELNSAHNGGFGVLPDGGTSITRGRFVFEMSPLTPDNDQLKSAYTIIASGTTGVSGTPVVFRVNQSGYIEAIIQ